MYPNTFELYFNLCFALNISGATKINVKISEWPFCGNSSCKYDGIFEVGDYLDFKFAVIGSRVAVKEETGVNSGLKFDVGSGKIVLSEKV